MNFDQALNIILNYLEQNKGATNSFLIEMIDGDTNLFVKVKEHLIFNDLVEDKKGVGLVYVKLINDEKDFSTNDGGQKQIPFVKSEKFEKSCKVFISYGRKDATELALRLANDLKSAGHDVWLDKEQIRTGISWEEQIEQAILSSDIFISLLTPHAVRRPDGVCLDEISMARYNNRRIIPLMVMNCRPPLGIYRLDWLDMQDWNNPVYYQKTVNRLKALFHTDENLVEGVHAKIFNALKPLDFKLDIYRHVKDFVGREWLIDDIIHWVNYKKENILFITGDPGSGKTALMAKLVHVFPNIGAYHFCMSKYEESLIPEKFIHSIASQLATQIPEYREILAQLNLDTIAFLESGVLIRQLIIQPLSLIQSANSAVIIIDGLDEALVVGSNNIVMLLNDWMGEFPPWIKIIFTSRKIYEIISLFDFYKPYEISVSRKENKLDIENYIREMFFEKNGCRFKIEDEIIYSIVNKSEGVFLYAKSIVQNLLSNAITIDEINSLPPGLGGIYQKNFKRIFRNEQDFLYLKPLLEIILATFQPTTIYEISRYHKSEYNLILSQLNKISEFFPEKDGTISIFHKSIADWLTGKNNRSHRFICDVSKGHSQIAEVLFEDWENQAYSDYVINYLPKHLFYGKQYERMLQLLIRFDYIEKRCAQRNVYRFLEDLKLLINSHFVSVISVTVAEKQVWDKGRHDYEAEIFMSNLSNEKKINIIYDFIFKYAEIIQLYGHIKDFLKQLVYNEGLVPFMFPLNETSIKNSPSFFYSKCFQKEYNPFPPVTKIFYEHKLGISDLSLNKEGNLLVSASFDRTVRLWNLTNGECVKKLMLDAIPETAVIAPDSSFIAIGGLIDDYSVVCYNLELNRVLFKLSEHTARIRVIKISDDNKRLVSCSSDKSFKVWELKSKTVIFEKKYKNKVLCCSISRDGSTVAISTGDNLIEIWNINFDVLLFSKTLDKGEIRLIVLSPDCNEIIIGGGKDKLTEVWNIKTQELIYTIEGHGNETYCVFLDPDKNFLLTGGKDRFLKLWDYKTGSLIKRLESHTRVTRRIAASGDMATVITGGGWNSDYQIRQWDIYRSLNEQSERAFSLSVSEVYYLEEYNLIVGINKKNIFVINTKTGDRNLLRNKMTIQSVKYLDNRLYVSQQNGIVEVYDFINKSWDIVLQHTDEITSMKVFGENNWIFGDWKGCVILQVGDRRITYPSMFKNKVKDILVGSKYIIVLGYDDRFVFIDRKSLKEDGSYDQKERITSNAILVNDRIYFGDVKGNISILELESKSLLLKIDSHNEDLTCIAYHDKSKRLVTGYSNGILKFWNPENLVLLSKIKAHETNINYINMLNDSSIISISGNYFAAHISSKVQKETTMKKWNVYTGECLAVYNAEELITAIDITKEGIITIGQRNGILHLFLPHPVQKY